MRETLLSFELGDRKRVSGSHHILSHPRVRELLNLQGVHGGAKPCQVRQLLQLIKRYNLEPGEDE
jgi:hypothetical protein